MAELESQSNLIIAEVSHKGRTFCIMALFYVIISWRTSYKLYIGSENVPYIEKLINNQTQ
jgi:hypothetical protein